MARKKEKKVLEKKNWVQNFTLIGAAVVKDYTFKIDEHSNKSDWIYNLMNLNVDCGDRHGKISCELMGGYSLGRENIIYVHGKNEDGSDDFENQYTIDWDDRFDEEYVKDIGRTCFINIGIERDTKENIVINRFLTPYDAISYLSENLKDGMEIKVRGQLKYSMYQGAVQVRKEVNSIYLAGEKDKKSAVFTQTVLLDKYSIEKPDKEKGVFPINGYVLEKFKEFNGNDLTEGGKVKGGKYVPLRKNFEYEYDLSDPERVKKAIDKVFKVKKDVNQITFEGIFVEGGATVQATEADLTDDIKELVELGYYTLEEALAKCSENGGKERRMLLKKPTIKLVGDEGSKVPQIQKFEGVYTDDDLMPEYMVKHEDPDDDSENEEVPFDEETASVDLDDDSWIDKLVE
jgi:hypothetical protein